MPASTNAGIFRFLEETTPGTIESGNPQIYRVESGTLAQTTESTPDVELRSDRGKGDSTLVSGSVSGPLNIAYSHKTHTDFLEALLASTFSPVDTNGIKALTDMQFNGSTHVITSATNDLPVLEKGQWFAITGASTSANNGVYRASSSVAPTSGSIAVNTEVKDATTHASDNTASISSSRLSQGKATLRSFTIERELSDITPIQFFTWKGVYVNGLILNYAIGEKLNGNFDFLGTETEDQDATTSNFAGLSGGGVAATTTGFMNTVTGTNVLLDGVSMGTSCVESLTVTVTPNLRERRCVGSGLAASSVGSDPFTVAFSASIYFGTTASAALYAKKIADTTLTFAVCLTDADGNGFAISIPRAKITESTVDGGGLSSDVMMSLSCEASTDSTFDTMIQIDVLGTTA